MPTSRQWIGLLVSIGFGLQSPHTFAAVRYVDAGAGSGGDGASWLTAFEFLQDALFDSQAGDEIWVADGTYCPDERSDWPDGGTGDRATTFLLIEGAAVYGGFSGGETARDQRDPATNRSILSGDIGTCGVAADNSYQVVTAWNLVLPTLLDGFTITAGNADGPASFVNNVGGGMHVVNADPIVVRCIFVSNTAELNGGATYLDSASPTLVACQFLGNHAASRGGAMAVSLGSEPAITECLFSGNTAGIFGGALYVEGASAIPNITNGTFTGNDAGIDGGGVYNFIASPTLTNCILWGNTDNGGNIRDAQISGGVPSVNHTCVQDDEPNDGSVYPGTGNTDDDPLFADPGGQDDQLGTEDDDLRITLGSPCIDSGNNTAVPADVADLDDDGDTAERTPLDLDENVRFSNDPDSADTGVADPPDYEEVVDMGAYEFIPAQEGCAFTCADIDGNTLVNLGDFLLFAGCLNTPPPASLECTCSDMDGDLSVDLGDFLIFAGLFDNASATTPPNCP